MYTSTRAHMLRYIRAWNQCGCVPARTWFQELSQKYASDCRRYHTLQHIAHTLRTCDSVSCITPKERRVIELALWYHDVVYVPGRTDNEERSAEYFDRHARQVSLAPSVRARVVTLIHYTKDHIVPELDISGGYLCDADCVVLGASWSAFLRYERGIQHEYRCGMCLDVGTYRKGRLAWVVQMCAREDLFHTRWFRDKYERRARRNLEKLSSMLT